MPNDKLREELRASFSNVVEAETATQILNCILPVIERAVNEAVAGAFLAAAEVVKKAVGSSVLGFQIATSTDVAASIEAKMPPDAHAAFEAAVKHNLRTRDGEWIDAIEDTLHFGIVPETLQ